MMVHTYRGGMYVSTETYPSIVECKKTLRDRGYTFRNDLLSDLGDLSEILRKDGEYVEVEEMLEEGKCLSVEGRVYLPLSMWANKHNMSDRRARYAFQRGRLPGLKVGRKNFLYLEEEE